MFDMNYLSDLMIPTIIVFSLVVGFILKKWLPTDNKYIPTILVILGGILGSILNGVNVESITAGMLSGLSSTGLHQLFSQYLKIDDTSFIDLEVDNMGPGNDNEKEEDYE